MLYISLLLGALLIFQVPVSSGFVEELATLTTPTGVIHGTLDLPSGAGPFPVALIIAGSGPTDRDGNSAMLAGKNNSLKMLAQSLASANIASLRFDKRGIASSTAAGPKEADLRFENYVEDAAAWAEQLRHDKRFSTVTIIGHSEGALIGAIATARAHPNAFISVAGVGRSAGLVLREQINGKLPAPLFQANEKILRELEAGRTTEDVPPALKSMYRASVQPYLISWFKHNPMEIVASIKEPILICQGTTDIQVAVEEAEALKKAAPTAKLVFIQGMNHVLKSVAADPAKQTASYSDPALPINPELMKNIIEFVPRVK